MLMKNKQAKCPLCASSCVDFYAQSEDEEYCTELGTFEFYKCGKCDILFISPMPVEQLDKIYPKNYYSFTQMRRNVVTRVKEWLDVANFRRVCSGIPGDNLVALDVGGGTGWLLDKVKTADARFTATWVADIDPGARAIAEKAGHRYALGPFEQFAPEVSFDLILMLNLIEHVADPVAILQHAATVLKPGGRIFIKTPNFDALDARIFHNHYWGGFHTPRHFVLFNERSIRRSCEASGLYVVDFHYTQGAPFWSTSVLGLLHTAGLIKISRERPMIYHPLMPLLEAIFAAFDFARKPFSKLSQMELVLGKLSPPD
jgi:2-polyprenyl-3-methyl-5-hydroxy-6-metoxy-1,4-benzoquinol methylase